MVFDDDAHYCMICTCACTFFGKTFCVLCFFVYFFLWRMSVFVGWRRKLGKEIRKIMMKSNNNDNKRKKIVKIMRFFCVDDDHCR